MVGFASRFVKQGFTSSILSHQGETPWPSLRALSYAHSKPACSANMKTVWGSAFPDRFLD
jgi:hypothetical protein